MRAGIMILLLALTPLRAVADAPHPVAAVGVVGTGGPGGCSGVLIEANLVLTAAHCIPKDRSSVTFRPGTYTDAANPSLPSAEVVVHPLYDLHSSVIENRIAFDLALIRLREPVPETMASAIPVVETPPPGGRLIVASYRGGLEPRARERPCPVVLVTSHEIRLQCRVFTGESGAPAIRKDPDGLRVAAIVTSQGNHEFDGIAFAAPASRATQLKALMTRGEGS